MAGHGGQYLCGEAGLAGALLVLPRRRVDVRPAEARRLHHSTTAIGEHKRTVVACVTREEILCTYLEDAVELVGGVVVEEKGQPWPDRPHRVPVPRRQPCIIISVLFLSSPKKKARERYLVVRLSVQERSRTY